MRYKIIVHDLLHGRKTNSRCIAEIYAEGSRDDRHNQLETWTAEHCTGYLDPNAELGNRQHSFWSAEGQG